MILDKDFLEIDSVEVTELAAKAIENELKKRSIFTKVTLKDGKIKSEDFTTTPTLFERLHIYGGYEITKFTEHDFRLTANIDVRFYIFDGGENGIHLFSFKCSLCPWIDSITLL